MCVAAVTYTQTDTYVLLSNVIMYTYMYIYMSYIYFPGDGLVEAEMCWWYVNVNKKL